MQSSNSSNGSRPLAFNEERYQAELRKLASVPLSKQISLLRSVYSDQPGELDETQFNYLFNVVTRRFLADSKNEISQKDFKDMVAVLCSYFSELDASLSEKYYNQHKWYLPPTMDLATAYSYEELKPILQKYQTLYGNNDPENSKKITEILYELDFNFQIATQNKPGTFVLFEGKPYERHFNINSSKLTAIDDAKLPKQSPEQSINMDGVRVNDDEIERNLREVPEKYKHLKKHAVKVMEYDPDQPGDPGKLIEEIVLPAGKHISDPDPLKQKLAAPSILSFGLLQKENKGNALQKQIKQLETKLQHVSQPKQVEVDGNQIENVVCRFEQIANLAIQLEIDRVEEEVLQINQMIELYKKHKQNKDEIKEAILIRLPRVDEQLDKVKGEATHPSEKAKLQIIELEINNIKTIAKELSIIPKKMKRNKDTEADEIFSFVEKEPLSSNLNGSSAAMQVDNGIPEVKEITRAQLAVLKRYFNRANKRLLDTLYSNEGTIVDKDRIEEVYNLIKCDKRAFSLGLSVMHPTEWDKVKYSPSPVQAVSTPNERTMRSQKKTPAINPNPSPTSSHSSGPLSNLSSPASSPGMSPPSLTLASSLELSPQDSADLSPASLSGQTPSDSPSRKRKLKKIEFTSLDVTKEESEGASMEIVQDKKNISQLPSDANRAVKRFKKLSDSPVESAAEASTSQIPANQPQPQVPITQSPSRSTSSLFHYEPQQQNGVAASAPAPYADMEFDNGMANFFRQPYQSQSAPLQSAEDFVNNLFS